ncbi:interferon regulatory factor 7 isoform X2 [Elgaria multicarinata webbii]|uniref:interferon regulatory factor 7 isoform X2 n=1 Tax=Elgaria multicarinata webbii TaxID=159646 RepID=UPI002FCCF3F4
MATNERGHQKVGFFDWLVKEISSGKYKGLYWLDENHTTFRIPWKHHSRKDLVDMDYKIFQAWAMFSEKYNEGIRNPSRWKINFRCAMMSTKRFEEVKLNNPDYHMYRIIPPKSNTKAAANCPANTSSASDHEDDPLHISPYSERAPTLFQSKPPLQQDINTAFKTLSLENPVPVPDGNTAENLNEPGGDLLHCIMQQANLNAPFSWSPAPVAHSIGEASYEQSSVYAVQNSCLLLGNRTVTEPVAINGYEEPSRWLAENTPNVGSQAAVPLPLQHAQQNSQDTNQINPVEVLYNNGCFIENMFMNEEPQGDEVMNNATRNNYQPTGQQVMMQQNIFAHSVVAPIEQPPVIIAPPHNNSAGTNPLNLHVSIYYRGKLLDESEVNMSSCMFTSNYCHHNYDVLDSLQIIKFPTPENLPDQKQVQHTLTLLQNAGLLLYQKNNKICAKRFGKCKVFWAFSKQLDNMTEHPEPRVLPREEDTEIFSYEKFVQELKDFRESRRSSPDYTIYLCFGQCFSAAKPKESKLILVKLVPKLCKDWHERAQREGASSLNSECSLLFSNSLPEMMEYLSSIFM